MKKTISILLISTLAVAVALAHEFWLLPSAWFVQPGQLVQIRVRVGEGFTGERWEGSVKRIVRFASRLGDQETDRLADLKKSGLDSLEVSFAQNGSHLVLLTTNLSSYHEMEAEKFEDYLVEDGLEHVRAVRRKRGETGKIGRERYRREAATLIQVGDMPSPVAFDKTGFDLQIRPEKNPLLADAQKEMAFQIRFMGKKLAGALIRHWRVDATGKAIVQMKITDHKGKVRFQLSPGEQMVSVVHMYPHPLPAEADWQSVWGNLTFCLR